MDLGKTHPRADTPMRGQKEGARSHLFVVLECSRPARGGARCALDEIDEVTIGRAAARAIKRTGRALRIGVPDPMMSSAHARIVRTAPDAWAVIDAGSTNGTLVDGEPISRHALEDDDVIEMGSTVLTVRALSTPPDAPRDADAEGASAVGRTTLLPAHAEAIASLEHVMRSKLALLLLGESGTGKEVLARATHEVSGRQGAFVAVNCGAIPGTLVESHLFGHVRGAFSGAARDELGLVRSADGGTLFLDEIGDLPLASQAALLRVLQEREVTPVGATRPVKVDLRVVSATHRPVDALSEGGFRNDLYARIAGYTHRLPPLRERREDLGILVGDILRDLAPERVGRLRLAPSVGRALYQRDWPLNVRGLRHALAAALVFATDDEIKLKDLPDAPAPSEPPAPEPLEELDVESAMLRANLIASLEKHRGNVSVVARELGRTRMQIHRWMKRFGVTPDRYRRG